jgi:uncharacterized membrane protein
MTANKKATRRNIHILQLFGTLLGLGLSLFLLIHHTELKTGIQDSSSFCSIGKYADCDVVNAGPFSEIFGFPIAALGALLYFTILLLIVAPTESKAQTQRTISWFAFSGLCVDFILLLIQAVLIHNFCLFCMATYIATAIILISGLLLQAQLQGVFYL